MKSLTSLVTLFAASAVLGLGILTATPAAAFDYGYNDRPWGQPHRHSHGWAGYGDEDYGDRGDQRYERPGYEVRSSEIAICPPRYHLGRGGELCWPN